MWTPCAAGFTVSRWRWSAEGPPQRTAVLAGGQGAELTQQVHLVEDRLVVDDLVAAHLEVVHEAHVEGLARRRDGAAGRHQVARMRALEVAEHDDLVTG